MISKEDLLEINTNKGSSLLGLSNEQPVMLVFLRHFGCIFCREALHDISKRKRAIESKNIKLVFVHMSDNETAQKYFDEYNLEHVEHISDPSCKYYTLFGLAKGSFTQLFGLKNWKKGFEIQVSGKVKGSLRLIGDGFQMPGIFMLHEGIVKEEYIYDFAADNPNYEDLIKCCVSAAQ